MLGIHNNIAICISPTLLAEERLRTAGIVAYRCLPCSLTCLGRRVAMDGRALRVCTRSVHADPAPRARRPCALGTQIPRPVHAAPRPGYADLAPPNHSRASCSYLVLIGTWLCIAVVGVVETWVELYVLAASKAGSERALICDHIHIHGDFIMLPHCETRPLAP